MIKVFAWQPKKTEIELLYKLIHAAMGEDQATEVLDLSQNTKPKLSEGDINIVCGTRCYNLLQDQGVKLVSIPAPKLLLSSEENKDTRKKTFDLLKSIDLENPVEEVEVKEITSEDLKKFTPDLILSLEQTLKNKNITHWIGKTLSGKSILLVLDIKEPGVEIDKFDLVLTFSELYSLKIASQMLNISTFTFVSGDKNNE